MALTFLFFSGREYLLLLSRNVSLDQPNRLWTDSKYNSKIPRFYAMIDFFKKYDQEFEYYCKSSTLAILSPPSKTPRRFTQNKKEEGRSSLTLLYQWKLCWVNDTRTSPWTRWWTAGMDFGLTGHLHWPCISQYPFWVFKRKQSLLYNLTIHHFLPAAVRWTNFSLDTNLFGSS